MIRTSRHTSYIAIVSNSCSPNRCKETYLWRPPTIKYYVKKGMYEIYEFIEEI